MKCRNCKRDIEEHSLYCNWCGVKQLKQKKKEVDVPRPRQLPSGSWTAKVTVGGARVSITRATEDEYYADAKAIVMGYVKPKAGGLILTSAIDDYIEQRENILSPSTIKGYRQIQKHYFQDLMHMEIADITSAIAQRSINRLARSYSPKTIRNSWGLISSVLDNSSIKVILPQNVQAERPFLDPRQIAVFCNAVKGTDIEIPALLALSSLRRSEIVALRWEDVDLSKRQINVVAASVYNENGKLVRKNTTKNLSSRRTVPILIEQLYDALCQSRSTGLVYTMTPNIIYRKVNAICQANDLPLVGVHGLRHSFASLAAHLGMPQLVAQRIGGWKNDLIMKRIYTHVSQLDIDKYGSEMSAFYAKIANEIANDK